MINLKNDLIVKIKSEIDDEFKSGNFIDDSDYIDEFLDSIIRDEISNLGLDYEEEMEFKDEYEDEIEEVSRIYLNEKIYNKE